MCMLCLCQKMLQLQLTSQDLRKLCSGMQSIVGYGRPWWIVSAHLPNVLKRGSIWRADLQFSDQDKPSHTVPMKLAFKCRFWKLQTVNDMQPVYIFVSSVLLSAMCFLGHHVESLILCASSMLVSGSEEWFAGATIWGEKPQLILLLVLLTSLMGSNVNSTHSFCVSAPY